MIRATHTRSPSFESVAMQEDEPPYSRTKVITPSSESPTSSPEGDYYSTRSGSDSPLYDDFSFPHPPSPSTKYFWDSQTTATVSTTTEYVTSLLNALDFRAAKYALTISQLGCTETLVQAFKCAEDDNEKLHLAVSAVWDRFYNWQKEQFASVISIDDQTPFLTLQRARSKEIFRGSTPFSTFIHESFPLINGDVVVSVKCDDIPALMDDIKPDGWHIVPTKEGPLMRRNFTRDDGTTDQTELLALCDQENTHFTLSEVNDGADPKLSYTLVTLKQDKTTKLSAPSTRPLRA